MRRLVSFIIFPLIVLCLFITITVKSYADSKNFPYTYTDPQSNATYNIQITQTPAAIYQDTKKITLTFTSNDWQKILYNNLGQSNNYSVYIIINDNNNYGNTWPDFSMSGCAYLDVFCSSSDILGSDSPFVKPLKPSGNDFTIDVDTSTLWTNLSGSQTQTLPFSYKIFLINSSWSESIKTNSYNAPKAQGGFSVLPCNYRTNAGCISLSTNIQNIGLSQSLPDVYILRPIPNDEYSVWWQDKEGHFSTTPMWHGHFSASDIHSRTTQDGSTAPAAKIPFPTTPSNCPSDNLPCIPLNYSDSTRTLCLAQTDPTHNIVGNGQIVNISCNDQTPGLSFNIKTTIQPTTPQSFDNGLAGTPPLDSWQSQKSNTGFYLPCPSPVPSIKTQSVTQLHAISNSTLFSLLWSNFAANVTFFFTGVSPSITPVQTTTNQQLAAASFTNAPSPQSNQQTAFFAVAPAPNSCTNTQCPSGTSPSYTCPGRSDLHICVPNSPTPTLLPPTPLPQNSGGSANLNATPSSFDYMKDTLTVSFTASKADANYILNATTIDTKTNQQVSLITYETINCPNANSTCTYTVPTNHFNNTSISPSGQNVTLDITNTAIPSFHLSTIVTAYGYIACKYSNTKCYNGQVCQDLAIPVGLIGISYCVSPTPIPTAIPIPTLTCIQKCGNTPGSAQGACLDQCNAHTTCANGDSCTQPKICLPGVVDNITAPNAVCGNPQNCYKTCFQTASGTAQDKANSCAAECNIGQACSAIGPGGSGGTGGGACIYKQNDGTCHLGKCLSGSDSCNDLGSDCGFVPGCSGTTVDCSSATNFPNGLAPTSIVPTNYGYSPCFQVNTALGPIETNPFSFIQKVFDILLSLSGGIALLLIIYHGYRLILSQGNPEAIKKAREGITSGIIGIIFAILSLAILQTIGVDILHLPGFGP